MGRPGFSPGEKTDWGEFRPVTPGKKILSVIRDTDR